MSEPAIVIWLKKVERLKAETMWMTLSSRTRYNYDKQTILKDRCLQQTTLTAT